MVFIMPKQHKEEPLMKRIGLEIALENLLNINIPEIFQSQLTILLKNNSQYVRISSKSCQQSFIKHTSIQVFFISNLHLNMPKKHLKVS